jgi:cell division septation protein DedD
MSGTALHTAVPGTKLRKGVFAAFAIAVTFGLGLSGWYLGTRILAAEGTEVEAAPQPVVVAGQASAVAPPAPIPTDVKSLQPEFYLGVTALGTAEDAKYLSQLKARGFDARMQASAEAQISRILIGPYTTRADLATAQRKLAAAGILALEATP